MKLVILGRDGVINADPGGAIISKPEDWEPLPGSLDAIGRLNRAGWRVVVATNQPGLRHKDLGLDALNRVHDRMHRQLAEVGGRINAILVCPCLPRDHCQCRKPAPGMLREIGERLRMPLGAVPCIGDGIEDVQAARAAGARPWLVRTGKGAATEAAGGPELDGVPVYDDLAAAAEALIGGAA